MAYDIQFVGNGVLQPLKRSEYKSLHRSRSNSGAAKIGKNGNIVSTVFFPTNGNIQNIRYSQKMGRNGNWCSFAARYSQYHFPPYSILLKTIIQCFFSILLEMGAFS
jgi:hypothetical protein